MWVPMLITVKPVGASIAASRPCSTGGELRHQPRQESHQARAFAERFGFPVCGGVFPRRIALDVRECVQLRLACSVGGSPTGVTIRSPLAWIAGRRETKFLKPIDKVSPGEIASHRAATQVNAQVASKIDSEGRAPFRRAKAARGGRKRMGATGPLRRGTSGGTRTRTGRATGEALLAPARKRRSRVGPRTGNTGKWAEGERVTEGRAVALRRGKARGAKAPCC